MPKRTFQPNPEKKKKTSGFLKRARIAKQSGTGSHVLAKRRAHGRKRLAA